jgi:very-short-patch-repair endonuclease
MNHTTSGISRLQRVEDYKLKQARELRQKMTPAERTLWEQVRNRKFNGYKFRRQQVIEGFIVDFYCEEAKLCVEVDGDVHDEPEQKEKDEHRTAVFACRGIRVLRVRNEDVLTNKKDILKRIIDHLAPGLF